ncbi:hypothetical protein GE118_02670 [Mycoplasma sp. NEAQ87857]|uniref:hypothetical protein n=1 Tax=Mycoplasma sp. NEAQ87857 TaxID=2683967 RepID=UPI00131635F9|nr:hypothetical protein [Mycoplasma sp. NEAQ87857]QGZ97698.1 hypothetical protein GE118_02670 [Mycoplasma sp. NEAQ87857]
MKLNKMLLFATGGISTSLVASMVACNATTNNPKMDQYQATQTDLAVKKRAANNLGTLMGPFRLIVRGTYALNDGLFAKRYTKLAGSDSTKTQAVEKFKTQWMAAVAKTVGLFKNDPKGVEYFVSNGLASSEEYSNKKAMFLEKAKKIMDTVVEAATALGVEGTYSSNYLDNLSDVTPLVNLIKNMQNTPLYQGDNWVPAGASVNDLARFLESQTQEVVNPAFPEDNSKKLPSGNFSTSLAKIESASEFTKVALIAISVLTQRMVTLFDGAINAAKIAEGKISLKEQQDWFNNINIKSNMTPRGNAVKELLANYTPYVKDMIAKLSELFAPEGKGTMLVNELKSANSSNEAKTKLLNQLTLLSNIVTAAPQGQSRVLLANAYDTLLNFFSQNDQSIDFSVLTKDLESFKSWYAKIGYSWNFALQTLFRLNDWANGTKDFDNLLTQAQLADNANAMAVLNAIKEVDQHNPTNNRFVFNQKVRWLTSLQQEILAKEGLK